MFEIEPHPSIPATLVVTSRGVWDMPTALAFERAVQAAIRALDCAPGEHLVLSDIRGYEAQSQEVVLICRGMFERGEDGRGVALLVGEGSARRQLPHVAGDGAVGVFEDRLSAEAWLRGRRASSVRAA